MFWNAYSTSGVLSVCNDISLMNPFFWQCFFKIFNLEFDLRFYTVTLAITAEVLKIDANS